ncbi:MAG: Mrp/NBP35 family ATP-binding protein [Planctomycetia bacterium]|nr:Mrp/NBP35 family ATP-binding protein [Planctomycetia bacterium]
MSECRQESSSGCDHTSCEGCEHSGSCPSQKDPADLIVKTNELNSIRKVIGVVSGKGGVGKSLVTSLLAASMSRRGLSVGILDADVTGPSIPKMFGLQGRATGDGTYLHPVKSDQGIPIMSVNLLLEDTGDPVLWRGPMIGGVVRQFWTDVVWGDLDVLFLDMPPGTGDVALTVFQSIPVDGIVVVTSPQELVSLIVGKAVRMARLMKIPVLGLVENLSYVECPDCGKKIPIFGESHATETASQYGIPALAQIPVTPSLASACDAGTIEKCESAWLDELIAKLPQ